MSTSVSQEDINRLRATFMKELEAKGENYIHDKDLERVKNNDHWIKRFLMHNEGDETKSLQMLWNTVNWRKEFGANEITEHNVKMDLLVKGGLFAHGKDIDGCSLLIFKCNLHTKGAVDMNEMKKLVIYWFERLEREGKGEPITIFFDMQKCGLSNMDMEFIKYLINLFKEYYPYFLNYILIFEMPWVLSAAFKIIKSWLPEKAVEKIKFLSSKDITTYVPIEEALVSWGGKNTYVFSFVPEEQHSIPKTIEKNTEVLNNNNNKKVHFVDGSETGPTSMSESNNSPEKSNDGEALKLRPSGFINFVREGNDLVGTLEIQNTDATANISYKFRTTSPEKFRVKPSTGCLAPGAGTTITITLVEGYQLGTVSKDKFLVLSTPVPSANMSTQELSELWKNTSSKKVHEQRLKCIQNDGDNTKNGILNTSNDLRNSTADSSNKLKNLLDSISKVNDMQLELKKCIKTTQIYQLITLVIVLVLSIALSYLLYIELENNNNKHCHAL